MKKTFLFVCMSLVTTMASAMTDQEYVQAVHDAVKPIRFNRSAAYGTFEVEVYVQDDAVQLKRRSGNADYDREVLRAAKAAYDGSISNGLSFPVRYHGATFETSVRSSGGSLFTRERSPF